MTACSSSGIPAYGSSSLALHYPPPAAPQRSYRAGRYNAHLFPLCHLVPMQGYQMYTSKNRWRHLSCLLLDFSEENKRRCWGNICRSSCLAAEGDADTRVLMLTALFIHVLIHVGLTYTIVSVGCSQDTAPLCTTHRRFSVPNRKRCEDSSERKNIGVPLCEQ